MAVPLPDFLKREAKRIKRAVGCTHTEALDHLAQERGYSSWADMAPHLYELEPLRRQRAELFEFIDR
ncbi:hypothetical protein [Azospirillum sp. sgz302134]